MERLTNTSLDAAMEREALLKGFQFEPVFAENGEVVRGMKYDSEKPRMDLLDFEALEGLAKVLTFGAKKYAAHNWRNGLNYSQLTAALLRHLGAIQRGEDVDQESGLPHIDHLGCCWMFLSNFMKTRPDLDDRWKGSNESK